MHLASLQHARPADTQQGCCNCSSAICSCSARLVAIMSGHMPDECVLTIDRRPKPVTVDRHQSMPPSTSDVYTHIAVSYPEREAAWDTLAPIRPLPRIVWAPWASCAGICREHSIRKVRHRILGSLQHRTCMWRLSESSHMWVQVRAAIRKLDVLPITLPCSASM